MRGDVAGIALEADQRGLPGLAEPLGELRRHRIDRAGGEEPELALEDASGPVKPWLASEAAITPPSAARPRCRRLTMPPVLDLAKASRPEDSESAMPSAEVISSAVRPISRPDPEHDLAGAHEGLDQRLARGPQLLGNGDCRRRQYRPRMDAGAKPAQRIELEGMRQRAIGQRGKGRVYLGARPPEDGGAPTPVVAVGVVDDDAAPGKPGAEDAGADGVDDSVAGVRPHLGGDVV